MYKMMTPGPTMVRENVLSARSRKFQNPDTDADFCEYYKETCLLISELLHTKNETLILDGEGILGLEAACASLTEPGDRVLVLDNGLYGEGFKDFVSMYGGKPVLYTKDYKNALDPDELEQFLQTDSNFKYATVVHCDTPSGMLNDISKICPILKKHGILTVVDSVSAMFGEDVRADEWKIDILCGGSQKAVSAPPGLTFVTVSEDAKQAMHARKTPIASFYANLTAFDGYYENKWFPYTMPASDIYGLRTAFENIKADENILDRHAQLAQYTRKAVTDMGLRLYQESGFSNTVTVFEVPDYITADEILQRMLKEHNIMLSGSFGIFAGKLIRIGHMGENATRENVEETISALKSVLGK
ncbi:MAG: pyridoxal-phosphate-dependent aminotransferase family protein [Acutalibacteraceae bacterium]